MSTIEDRLTAALNARADQVHREHLKYADPPRAAVARAPRVALYAVAAAACAAAIAAPFVVGGGAGEPDPQPLRPATEAPSPNGDEVPGGDWSVAYRYDEFDVDGDGEADELVIRTQGTEQLPRGPRRMEVDLSSGGQAAVILDYPTYDLTAIGPVELDSGPGDEILYYRGTIDDGRDIGVVDLVDGALVDLTVPDDPGITAISTERDGWRGRHYWVEGGRLFTLRTVEGGFVPAGPSPGAPPYQVEVWQWRINDGALQAVPRAQQCWDQSRSPVPYPCSEAAAPVPGSGPEAPDSIGSGEQLEANVDGDGSPDLVALEGPTDGGDVEDGEVLLVVTLGAGGELSAPLPGGPAPVLRTTTVLDDRGDGLLLVRATDSGATMSLYLVRDDELVIADVAGGAGGVRLASGQDTLGGESGVSVTYVTRDGGLWTRRQAMSAPEDEWVFHRWSLDGTTLVPGEGRTGCLVC